MENKKPRRKATKAQKEARRAARAKLYNEAFSDGWEACEKMHQQRMDKLCRQNCGVTE